MHRGMHRQKVGKGVMVGNQINRVKTCKHILCFFSNYQRGTAFSAHLWVIFSPNKVYCLSNYTGSEMENQAYLYDTVNSPAEATHFMLLSHLWSAHCPLSPLQGKAGASQTHPFNYLLVVLVKGYRSKTASVLYNKRPPRSLGIYPQTFLNAENTLEVVTLYCQNCDSSLFSFYSNKMRGQRIFFGQKWQRANNDFLDYYLLKSQR